MEILGEQRDTADTNTRRVTVVEDEDLLMVLLNSAPVVDGKLIDQLSMPSGRELLSRFGGTGTEAELLHLRRTRDGLQSMIRKRSDAAEHLTMVVGEVSLMPAVTSMGVQWELSAPSNEQLGARAVLAWSQVMNELPGRLRGCANTECNLFLIDHSRPGKAKWCSMALCGNRMKARTHARRTRGS